MALSQSDLLRKAHYVPLLFVLGYAALLALLTIPAIQRELLFLHHVPIPLFPDFTNPERYGLAPFKTRNLRLNTSDGESIGAWHVLPRSVYQDLRPFPPEAKVDDDLFDRAFGQRPTIIYFHGNAGNRATPHRVRSYSAFSTNLDCNVLAIDYRGYGDSSGIPSEAGLLTDARTAFDFVHRAMRAHSDTTQVLSTTGTDIGARQGLNDKDDGAGRGESGSIPPEKNIILVGQSLGTGVVSGLAENLAREGIYPRALVVIAPFTSITELLTSYRLFRFIPILGPLGHFPIIQRFFQSFLYDTFDSKIALANTTSPTLLLHAVNDRTIPHSHSADLFASLSLGRTQVRPIDAAALSRTAETTAVSVTPYEGWGTVRSFNRDSTSDEVSSDEGKGKGKVVWWEGKNGGHDNLGWAEGTLHLIARIANL
ncbi:hypothetical protein IAU59_002559 [Kwoniella sp. CBS 9459]